MAMIFGFDIGFNCHFENTAISNTVTEATLVGGHWDSYYLVTGIFSTKKLLTFAKRSETL